MKYLSEKEDTTIKCSEFSELEPFTDDSDFCLDNCYIVIQIHVDDIKAGDLHTIINQRKCQHFRTWGQQNQLYLELVFES